MKDHDSHATRAPGRLPAPAEQVPGPGAPADSPRIAGQAAQLARLRLGQAQPAAASAEAIQRQPASDADSGGLPAPLRAGMEALSGMPLGDVRVHYGSPKPAQLEAHAYAQGRDIHLAPGQEKHLPHEAWHVVQQAQGRVKPTLTMGGGVPVNDQAALEREADAMGAKAMAAQRAKR